MWRRCRGPWSRSPGSRRRGLFLSYIWFVRYNPRRLRRLGRNRRGWRCCHNRRRCCSRCRKNCHTSSGRSLIAVPRRRYLYSLNLILCRRVRCLFHKRHIYCHRRYLCRNTAAYRFCNRRGRHIFQNKNCHKGRSFRLFRRGDRKFCYILPFCSVRRCQDRSHPDCRYRLHCRLVRRGRYRRQHCCWKTDCRSSRWCQ